MPQRTTHNLDAYQERTALLLRIARASAKLRAATTMRDRTTWRIEWETALDAWAADDPRGHATATK